MQLQVNYQCDICSESFMLDFEQAIKEKKLKCTNCGVVYKFTEKELDEFNKCYLRLLARLNESKKESSD
jgi:uncharacterized Zn finger protein